MTETMENMDNSGYGVSGWLNDSQVYRGTPKFLLAFDFGINRACILYCMTSAKFRRRFHEIFLLVSLGKTASMYNEKQAFQAKQMFNQCVFVGSAPRSFDFLKWSHSNHANMDALMNHHHAKSIGKVGFNVTLPPNRRLSQTSIPYFLLHQMLSTFQSHNELHQSCSHKHRFETKNHCSFMELSAASSVGSGTKDRAAAGTSRRDQAFHITSKIIVLVKLPMVLDESINQSSSMVHEKNVR